MSGPHNPRASRHRRTPRAFMPTSFGTKKSGVWNSTLAPQYIVPPSASLAFAERHVARTDAGGREAAHQVRTHLEVVEHAQIRRRPSRRCGRPAGGARRRRPDRLVVAADIAGGADEVHVAADAGEVLLEIGEQAAGRVPVVVERVVGERVADQRGQDRALRQFAPDRQRGFAVWSSQARSGRQEPTGSSPASGTACRSD